MILADLGADTIKVEPLHGEGTRKLLATSPEYSIDDQGAYFITLNRNKQSVAVDLKTPKGLEVFHDLVKTADIVIDNFSAGVTHKLKIDYARLSTINPRIITCSISGFGSSGPNYQRPAFDQVSQALGGGMSITGTDKDHPTRAGIPIGDLSGGMFGVMGILAALHERERSGQGQHVDISMLDCQISLLSYMATMYFLSEEDPCPMGNAHFVHVPYNSYSTADGHIIVAVIFDSFWENLLEVVDYPPFHDDKYKTQPGRLADRELIDDKLNEIFSSGTSEEWLARLEAKRIPCARVNQFSQALCDEQVLARNMVVQLQHPRGQSTRGPGNPIKLSRTDEESFSPAPLLGEHTDAVLAEVLGYPPERISGLKAAGIVI
jgi:crotonobetainyl-CoA:carnitine CoA-transferase CaiB-like acyl-CoA transferase